MMKHRPDAKILEILVPPGKVSRKIGFALTDYVAVEIISECCSELIRCYTAGDTVAWRCCKCGVGVAEVSTGIPSSCRLTMDEIDDGTETAVEWVARWSGIETADVEIVSS